MLSGPHDFDGSRLEMTLKTQYGVTLRLERVVSQPDGNSGNGLSETRFEFEENF